MKPVKSYSGFTLTEMAVACSLGLMAMILVFGVALNSLQAFQRSEGRLFGDLEFRKASSHLTALIQKSSYVYIKNRPGENGGKIMDSGFVLELYDYADNKTGEYDSGFSSQMKLTYTNYTNPGRGNRVFGVLVKFTRVRGLAEKTRETRIELIGNTGSNKSILYVTCKPDMACKTCMVNTPGGEDDGADALIKEPTFSVRIKHENPHSYYDHGYSIKQTPDRGYIILPNNRQYPGEQGELGQYGPLCITIIKINDIGEYEWSKLYKYHDGENPYLFWVFSIENAIGGGYIIAGYVRESLSYSTAGSAKACLLKTDADGNPEWMKVFDDDIDDPKRSEFFSVITTSDGEYYVAAGWCASVKEPGEKMNLFIVKIDANGSVSFQKDNDDSVLYELTYCVSETFDNNGGSSGFIMSGHAQRGIGLTRDAYIIKLNATGTREWSRTFDFNSLQDAAHSVQQTSDGGFIISGASLSSPNRDIMAPFLIKIDDSGNKQWSKTLYSGYIVGTVQWNRARTTLAKSEDKGYVVSHVYHTGEYDYTEPTIRLTRTDVDGNILNEKLLGYVHANLGYRSTEVPLSTIPTYNTAGELSGYAISASQWVSGQLEVCVIKTAKNLDCPEAANPTIIEAEPGVPIELRPFKIND